jgi:hypothetical protein
LALVTRLLAALEKQETSLLQGNEKSGPAAKSFLPPEQARARWSMPPAAAPAAAVTV